MLGATGKGAAHHGGRVIQPITEEQRARLGGRRVVASLSTGKDSVGLCLWLREQGIEHDRIFFDTRWEHRAVAEHLAYLRETLGAITDLRGPLGMKDLIRAKGMFPRRTRRFCTEQLKTFPAIAYLNARADGGDELINAVGIRRDESEARKSVPEWEWMDGFDCEVWRPLVDWAVEDVIAIHKRHGVRPNRLYLMGAERVGCWPCINSNKGELRMIADTDPGRIDEIRALEAEVGIAAKLRYDAKLRRFHEGGAEALTARERRYFLDEATGQPKPFNRPTFFQAPIRDENGERKCITIDDAVAWSRSRRGGKEEDRQADLLAFGGINDGCMRWGMCETAPPNRNGGRVAGGPVDRCEPSRPVEDPDVGSGAA